MQKHVRQELDATASAYHDLALRSEASTEWWFVQGRLRSATLSEQTLMAALLRRRGRALPEEDGWMLLVSLADPATGVRSVSSLVSDSQVRILAAETVDILVEAGMPRELAKAYNEELVAYGPPRPIRVSSAPVRIGAGALDIEWEQFSMRQVPDGSVALSLPIPQSDASLELTLCPTVPWSEDKNAGADTDFGAMRYALCPRLALSGRNGDKEVTGRAWFDHQWGGNNWFEASQEKKQVLGWAWLGVNCEDGRDMLVAIGQDMASGEIIETASALYYPAAPRRMLEDVRCRVRAHWCSPDSHAEYPIAWEIELPEIGAMLQFLPDRADCEIPVYGFFGAVWEGAGRVAGIIGGKSVKGSAHLELFGYALPAAFERIKAGWIERIDNHIAAVLPKEISDAWLATAAGPPRYRFDTAAFGPMLSEPNWTLMSRGGKHWRAVFAILMLRALGADIAKYEALITTIPEMLHAGSLMIDDIQDHSDLRRGGAAIHHLFGEEITINAANTMYFLPLQAVARHPHLELAQREAIHRIAIDLFVAAHMGQAQDLYSQNWALDHVLEDPGRYAEIVLQTCALKTGAPVRALAEMLCVIARCEPALTKAAMDFAEAAGIAYQIMDDVNSFAAGEAWGKETGEDIREGRLTYVILSALEALPPARRDRLAETLSDARAGRAEQREACALVAESGVLETCRADARSMIDGSWHALSDHLPPSQSKTMLRLMFARLFAASQPPPQN